MTNNYEYVDLGLPSGTLWATRNVGASSPEEYGMHLGWGEIETQTSYTWSSYFFANNDQSKYTKYCSDSVYGYDGYTDDLTELELMDDVAYINWGSEWCMPTQAQAKELYNSNYTSVSETTQNGVHGFLITSKVEGYTDRSIFLPSGGYVSNSSPVGRGKVGNYWTRTKNSDPRYAMMLVVGTSQYVSQANRYYGCCVRAVRRQ